MLAVLLLVNVEQLQFMRRCLLPLLAVHAWRRILSHQLLLVRLGLLMHNLLLHGDSVAPAMLVVLARGLGTAAAVRDSTTAPGAVLAGKASCVTTPTERPQTSAVGMMTRERGPL